MKVKLIEKHWSGKTEAILDCEECLYRPCLHLDFNKGSYTKGRGYTYYYENPDLVCMTSHVHGCPMELPELIAERARCCPAPTFAKARGNPKRQRCKVCGTWHKGVSLRLAKTLPHHPHSRCSHDGVQYDEFAGDAAYHCLDCGQWWDLDSERGLLRPEPYALGETFQEWRDRKCAEWNAKIAKKRAALEVEV